MITVKQAKIDPRCHLLVQRKIRELAEKYDSIDGWVHTENLYPEIEEMFGWNSWGKHAVGNFLGYLCRVAKVIKRRKYLSSHYEYAVVESESSPHSYKLNESSRQLDVVKNQFEDSKKQLEQLLESLEGNVEDIQELITQAQKVQESISNARDELALYKAIAACED